MKFVETVVKSKTGHQEDCEDRIVCTNCFACVVDGATSQSTQKWNGVSGGTFAANEICKVVRTLDPDASARDAVEAMTESLAVEYRKSSLVDRLHENPIERAAASFVMYSASQQQLWMVGDCQALLVFDDDSTKAILNAKRVDEVCSAARAMFVESELAQGKTALELRREDTGRRYIQPLIDRQFLFQNHHHSMHAYSVIDGFPVSESGIRILDVSNKVHTIVLASDGYPKIFATLDETESYRLQALEEDPLLIQVHKSVHGFAEQNDSYDDRAYIRVSVAGES